MRNLNTSRGFSIVEALIAMALVSILSYSILSFFPAMKSVEIGSRASNSCRAYLDASFGNVMKYGILGSTDSTLIPTLTDTNLPAHPGNTYSSTANWANLGLPNSASPEMTNQQLFPMYSQALISWTDSTHLTTFRTAGMISGAMSVVNALYNNLSSVCSSTYSYSTLTSNNFFPAPPTDFQKNFSLTVNIVPYNWRTHAAVACGTSGYQTGTFIPAPLGVLQGVAATSAIESSPTGAYVAGSTTLNTYFPTTGGVADIRNNLALQMTLTASHDENGRTYKCSETKVFGYPAYLTRPNAPDVTTFNYSGTTNAIWGPDVTNMTVGYLSVAATPGTILLCKDNSTILGLQSPSLNAFYNSALSPDPSGYNAWVPCERVTACGKMQDNGLYATSITPSTNNNYAFPYYSTPSDNTAFILHMRWTNNGSTASGNHGLPYNCNVSIAVKAVDPAGNVSAASSTIFGKVLYVGN